MQIKRVESNLLLSNMYLVIEDNHAVVIDPCMDTSAAEGLIIDKIILTHEHIDHISGVNCWKKARDAPVVCNKACAENIRDPRKSLAAYFTEFYELQTWVRLQEIPYVDPKYSCAADETFEDEISFDWRGHCWRLFEMPGHSDGSIGIMLDELHFFSGDSLINNYDIALRFPGGSRKKWKDVGSKRLAEIPSGIQVHPGHFEEFVLMDQIQ